MSLGLSLSVTKLPSRIRLSIGGIVASQRTAPAKPAISCWRYALKPNRSRTSSIAQSCMPSGKSPYSFQFGIGMLPPVEVHAAEILDQVNKFHGNSGDTTVTPGTQYLIAATVGLADGWTPARGRGDVGNGVRFGRALGGPGLRRGDGLRRVSRARARPHPDTAPGPFHHKRGSSGPCPPPLRQHLPAAPR